jgi:hypothetical protein
MTSISDLALKNVLDITANSRYYRRESGKVSISWVAAETMLRKGNVMRKVTVCRVTVVLCTMLIASAAWAGIAYVNFDDGTRGNLTTGGPLHLAPFNFVKGVVTFEDNEAFVNCLGTETYSVYSFDFTGYVGYGKDAIGGSYQPELNGPPAFTAPVTFEFTVPDPDELRALHNQATKAWFGVWNRLNNGNYDRCCGAINDGGTIKIALIGGTGVIQGTTPIAEALPPEATRVSIKMVRTATTIECWAAYDADATTPDHPGNFHKLGEVARDLTHNQQFTSLQVYGYDVGAPGGVWGVHIDDVIVTGDTVPFFPPPPVGGVITCNYRPGFIEAGMDVILTAPSGTSYQWKESGDLLIGETSQTLEFNPIEESDGGSYTVVYEDGTKVLNETPPFALDVLPAGSVPVAGLIGLGVMGLAACAGGAAFLRGRKRHS